MPPLSKYGALSALPGEEWLRAMVAYGSAFADHREVVLLALPDMPTHHPLRQATGQKGNGQGMIFYSWGQKHRFLTEGPKIKCPHCDRETEWAARFVWKYFRLYGLTVFEWDKAYALSCPICEHGYRFKREAELQDMLKRLWREQRP